MKVNFAGTRHLTEKMLPLMSEGSAIVSISSNGGLGWSRRIPVLMEAIGQQGFDAFMKWCEANPDTVREGYSFSKELVIRSEEHTSELHSLMRTSYAFFCLKNKKEIKR